MRREETEQALNDEQRKYLNAIFQHYHLNFILHYNERNGIVEIRAREPRKADPKERYIGPLADFLQLTNMQQHKVVQDIYAVMFEGKEKRDYFIGSGYIKKRKVP